MNWVDFNPPETTFEVLSNVGETLDTSPTPPLGGTELIAEFNPLTPNTTYSFGVRAHTLNDRFSTYATTTAVTNAVKPITSSLKVFKTSATVTWNAAGNPSQTRYELRASLDESFERLDDVVAFVIGETGDVEGEITGLIPDTSYHFGVRAWSHGGSPTLWATFEIPFFTGVQPPQPPYQYINVTTDALRLEWGSGGNPDRVEYLIERSKNDEFAPLDYSNQSTELSLTASDLSYNTTYYFQGKSIVTLSESGYVSMGSTVTLATTPVVTSLLAGLDFMELSFEKNGNPEWTTYFAQAADNAVFLDLIPSDPVNDSPVRITGLEHNTTYWVQMAAVNSAQVPSEFVFAGTSVTLANVPTQAGLRPKWSAALGNYMEVSIGLGDNNPDTTRFAIFNVDNSKYLSGDGNGTETDTPVWFTREEWSHDINGTADQPIRGAHEGLAARTNYTYQVKAINHAGVETGFSIESTMVTVPEKPNLSVVEVDHDYMNLASTD